MNLQDSEERETAIVIFSGALIIAALASGKELTPETALKRAAEFIEVAERRFPNPRKPKSPLR